MMPCLAWSIQWSVQWYLETKQVASLLNNQKTIGWFQGRMEFGPRALGGRSILADPRSEKMQKVLNLKVKFRESFRPFAPSVLKEDVEFFQYLELHMRGEAISLVGRDHLSYRSYYLPSKVRNLILYNC